MAQVEAPRLLYVEDEALIAMVVTIALEEAGYAVEQAYSGAEAVALLEERIESFSEVVTDIRLPEVDGWSIARRARELNPELPVVYITGDSAVDWSSKGVPGSIILQKPCPNYKLVEVVRQLVNDAMPVARRSEAH